MQRVTQRSSSRDLKKHEPQEMVFSDTPSFCNKTLNLYVFSFINRVKLKEEFTFQTLSPLFTLMESQVGFKSHQNISGASKLHDLQTSIFKSHYKSSAVQFKDESILVHLLLFYCGQ